jgi:hypothetical protein
MHSTLFGYHQPEKGFDQQMIVGVSEITRKISFFHVDKLLEAGSETFQDLIGSSYFLSTIRYKFL